MVRICFYCHFAAVMISFVVTRFEALLSNRVFETFVIWPLVATMCLGPCATTLAVLLSRDRKPTDVLAMIGSVLLYGLQCLIWLPAVQ